jgi:hypothetical protein
MVKNRSFVIKSLPVFQNSREFNGHSLQKLSKSCKFELISGMLKEDILLQ